MLNIVLFGPPGAGKGTQSEKLISEFQLVHLSTGDILRAEVAAGTELGEEAKKLMDEGKLVPDEIVIGMISSKLDQNKNAKGFIFDGFPRTVHQAKALDRLLSDKNTGITKMISLKVTDEELTQRLLLRGKETGRPDDQNEEIIRTRIQEYFDKTAPLEDYYAAQDKFEAIDGIGSVNEIFYAISNVIKAAQKESGENEEEELVDSEGETERHHKQAEESFVSKVTHIAKVVKDVVSSKLHDVMHPEGSNGTAKGSAEKLAKKALKKAVAKKTNKVEADKPAAKKVAKKAPAKSAKKAAPKKAAKKAAPAKKSAPKKSAAKAAKKAAPKKAAKKVVKKAAKKVAPKKAVKKVAKSVKKVVKKAAKKAAKKVTKKVAKKAAKKSLAKKAIKKTVKKVIKKAAKKAPKKVAKKAAKKAAPKKAAKKGGAKKGKSAKKGSRR